MRVVYRLLAPQLWLRLTVIESWKGMTVFIHNTDLESTKVMQRNFTVPQSPDTDHQAFIEDHFMGSTMIFDRFDSVERYSIPQLDRILQFISKNDCLTLPNEQIDIDGKSLFVRVMEYHPKPAAENKFETHQVYADLQYVVSGIELMKVAPQSALTSLGPYDAKGDYEFFKAQEQVSDLVVNTGDFTVFYPGEAHCPSCLYGNPSGKVKKLVFKIKMK
jgi:biofilm protein TabA